MFPEQQIILDLLLKDCDTEEDRNNDAENSALITDAF